jgi:hypothetical protein
MRDNWQLLALMLFIKANNETIFIQYVFCHQISFYTIMNYKFRLYLI